MVTDQERALFTRAARFGTADPIYKCSEDDEVANYICKLQRHSALKLSGWNSACIEDAHLVDGYVVARLDLQSVATSPCEEPSPLSMLAWDIEVSTRTGAFDQNGADPYNCVICIGVSYREQSVHKQFVLTYTPCEALVDQILCTDERDMYE